MKPISRRIKHTSLWLQKIEIGPVVAKIQGSVKELGEQYNDATIVLYNKTNLQPISVRRPDKNGNYQFSGLSINTQTFIVAFDRKQQYNAVIQDNVRPK